MRQVKSSRRCTFSATPGAGTVPARPPQRTRFAAPDGVGVHGIPSVVLAARAPWAENRAAGSDFFVEQVRPRAHGSARDGAEALRRSRPSPPRQLLRHQPRTHERHPESRRDGLFQRRSSPTPPRERASSARPVARLQRLLLDWVFTLPYTSRMRAKLGLGLALAVGACGQTAHDSPIAGSAGAAGDPASGGVAGVGGAGAGSSAFGGGGVLGGTGGVIVGGGGFSGSGSGGVAGSIPCMPSNCKPDEYCANGYGSYCGSFGPCEKRPKSCPGDCDGVCSCGGAVCNVCVSRMFGHDTAPLGSWCMSDGGGPNTTQAGLGQPCGYYSGVCVTGLKCCYPCQVAGCQTACMPPDASGMCPTITVKP